MNNANASLIHDLDAIEAAAYRDLFAAAPVDLAASLRLATRDIAGATLLMAPGLPTPMFNRVIGLGNAQPASESDLDAIAGAYRDAGIRSWWIQLSPGAQPDPLADRLVARGFTAPERKAWVKVLRDAALPAAVETGLDVRPVRNGEEQLFAETLCAAFEMPAALAPWYAQLANRPSWRAVAAFDQENMVGCGLLHIQGMDAWLGAGGVRPEARGHHAHRAMMALRIRLAIDAGCTRLATETGEPVSGQPNPSLRNMDACGFKRIFSRLNLAAPA